MDSAVRYYKESEVYQKAIDLTTEGYRTIRCFPDAERFGMTAQVRRAAVSTAANIAEVGEEELPESTFGFC